MSGSRHERAYQVWLKALRLFYIYFAVEKNKSKMGPNDAPVAEKNAKEVGLAFAKKYYEGAIHGSDGVMELFGDNSVYVGTNGKEARGLEDIRTAIGNLNLQEGKILVVSINAAFTDNGGIMVQCLANYITEKTKSGFSESFHLVPQSKGWYVRSCLFKWHEESSEDAKSKDTTMSAVVKQPKRELANGHETKKHTPEVGAKATEEAKKPSDDRKASQPKDRNLTNGTSTPPSTPAKNIPAPQKDTKSPLVSAVPVAPSAAPPAPTSWAACVGGSTKSANAAPVVTNNESKNVKTSATTVNAAASDTTIKSAATNVTTITNGNTSADLESTQDKQHRHNKKPARAKSDFTVHVSKIVKGKKATERDVVVDITKAFQEFGPVTHVRVPGRRLADDNESTLYAFVDFQEKDDFEKIFADRDQDNEGRVKLTINLPVLSFNGEVIIAQNHDRAGRNFYRNNRRASDNHRPAGNNGRPGNGRPSQRPSRNNGHSGNRPPQTGNRNHSDNRHKENGTIKAKN
uniref:NTF2 domain-containing protein n=1 Tax=Panagrolaimus superbus TaxID=310955 RepID=A0A914XVC0_9BILA